MKNQTNRSKKISGLNGVASIAPGGNKHSCVVQIDGAAFCWGRNNAGQLGDGTFMDREMPTPVSGLGPGTTIGIATSYGQSCALKTDGSVVCWSTGEKRVPTIFITSGF